MTEMQTKFDAPPESPCIGVCQLDVERVCVGCGRTVDEITAWSKIDAAAQWVVLKRAEARMGKG